MKLALRVTMARHPAIVWCSLIALTAALNADDFEVGSLPGLETPPTFRHYSGLLPIGDAAGTSLFFWFVESASSPRTDPLCLWTNGGPGASSVAFGFWTEHGPWRLERTSDGNIRPTPYMYSWNRRANVLYVEMPTGVGFSQSTDVAHYVNITDDRAASDTYAFLRNFYKLFPNFRSNPLYLTGESYGGHYIPMLAAKVYIYICVSHICVSNVCVSNMCVSHARFDQRWHGPHLFIPIRRPSHLYIPMTAPAAMGIYKSHTL